MSWQPIETAPRNGTWVLLRWIDEVQFEQISKGAFHTGYRYWHCPFCMPDLEPTHWMPLPEPPEKVTE